MQGGEEVLTIAALFIGGIILLFVGLSIAGLLTTEDGEPEAADSGVFPRRS